jgi:hypothetical protein
MENGNYPGRRDATRQAINHSLQPKISGKSKTPGNANAPRVHGTHHVNETAHTQRARNVNVADSCCRCKCPCDRQYCCLESVSSTGRSSETATSSVTSPPVDSGFRNRSNNRPSKTRKRCHSARSGNQRASLLSPTPQPPPPELRNWSQPAYPLPPRHSIRPPSSSPSPRKIIASEFPSCHDGLTVNRMTAILDGIRFSTASRVSVVARERDRRIFTARDLPHSSTVRVLSVFRMMRTQPIPSAAV